jgi:hypothetical protein
VGAAEQLARLMGGGGVLIADEFDYIAADTTTAAWFYGTWQLLTTMGVLEAVAARFDLCAVERVEYLRITMCSGWRAPSKGGTMGTSVT